jgi:hypothetical protein
MGRKWQKKARSYKEQVTSGPLPAAKTSYTYYGQGIQFESDEAAGTSNALSYILHEEGRVIKDPQSGGLAYEYHYQDHLGNLRVAFRQQTPVVSSATLARTAKCSGGRSLLSKSDNQPGSGHCSGGPLRGKAAKRGRTGKPYGSVKERRSRQRCSPLRAAQTQAHHVAAPAPV